MASDLRLQEVRARFIRAAWRNFGLLCVLKSLLRPVVAAGETVVAPELDTVIAAAAGLGIAVFAFVMYKRMKPEWRCFAWEGGKATMSRMNADGYAELLVPRGCRA
ncbi:MAG TPA: hypothetical protein VEB22_10485 [Phycisphaerales bacterium]|nr:hypothetical protein [Phycisphaerales bacterium]